MNTPRAALALTSPSPMINPQSAQVLHQISIRNRKDTDCMKVAIIPSRQCSVRLECTINISDFFAFSDFSSNIMDYRFRDVLLRGGRSFQIRVSGDNRR